MKQDETNADRLVALSSLKDYKVAKDNPDVLGWRVLGADGESLGLVKDLIVDLKAMKTRYLSVMTDRRFFNTSYDPYVLVPVGAAALDKKGRKVFVSTIDARNIGEYPVYPGGPIPPDYEYAVRDRFQRSHREALADNAEGQRPDTVAVQETPRVVPQPISDDFYNTEAYNEDRFYTAHPQVPAGSPYPAYDPDRPETPAETQPGEGKPKTVEEAIATIERLEHLRERGSLTEEEFKTLKKRALDL
ncbi:MAG: PRC-barrel domain-containing protein [Adhaeribacter sp.]